jgi:hypothetical protein
LTPRGTVQWGHLKKPRIPAGASLSVPFQPSRSLFPASFSLVPKKAHLDDLAKSKGSASVLASPPFNFHIHFTRVGAVYGARRGDFGPTYCNLRLITRPKSLVLLCLLIVSDARRHREHVATQLPKTSPSTSDAVMTRRRRTAACPTRTRPHAQHGSVRILLDLHTGVLPS